MREVLAAVERVASLRERPRVQSRASNSVVSPRKGECFISHPVYRVFCFEIRRGSTFLFVVGDLENELMQNAAPLMVHPLETRKTLVTAATSPKEEVAVRLHNARPRNTWSFGALRVAMEFGLFLTSGPMNAALVILEFVFLNS